MIKKELKKLETYFANDKKEMAISNAIKDGYMGTDIAKYLGVTKAAVSKIYTNYKQKIKLIFWEESFTAFKDIKFQKLILWTNTTEWIIMNYIITSWQDMIRFPKEIKWTKLLQQWRLINASKGSMLGQTILGLWLIWQDDSTLDYLYPKVWAVKINLGYACEMLEWELVATSWQRIVYWWQMIGYEQAQPWLTSIKNII